MNFVLKPEKIVSYNSYLHYNKRGHRYITKEGWIYKNYITNEVSKIMLENDWSIIIHKIKLDVVYKFKGFRRRDLDDADKPLWDILNKVLYDDDSQIFEHSCKKILGCKENEIFISVSKYIDDDEEIMYVEFP